MRKNQELCQLGLRARLVLASCFQQWSVRCPGEARQQPNLFPTGCCLPHLALRGAPTWRFCLAISINTFLFRNGWSSPECISTKQNGLSACPSLYKQATVHHMRRARQTRGVLPICPLLGYSRGEEKASCKELIDPAWRSSHVLSVLKAP